MIAGHASRNVTIGLAMVVIGGGLVLWAPIARAEGDALAAPDVTTQATLNAITRRAEQILAERGRAARLQVSGEFSQGVGYERNPSYASDHKGSSFTEDDLYLALSKKLTPTVTWQGTYSGSYLYYVKLAADTYSSQTLTPLKLIWRPNQMWRMDGGVDLSYLWYLSLKRSEASNYQELKPWVGVRQNLFGTWFQSVRYQWFVRHYLSARARDGAGKATRSYREDHRDGVRYELGTTWHDTLVKARYDWYLNDSNDARNDFYDAQDNKATLSISKSLTRKFSVLASYAHELKHYAHRPVTGITPKKVRYDEIHTWALAGNYDFNPTWSLSPSFSYSRNNSNDPTGEYYDWAISTALTAHF